MATGRAKSDPCRDLRGALTPVKGKHFRAATDPARLGELLRVLDGYEGTYIVRGALRLAPLVILYGRASYGALSGATSTLMPPNGVLRPAKPRRDMLYCYLDKR